MKKIRLGVVGCGGIFQWAHLPAIMSLKNEIEIVAVCDTKLERTSIAGIPETAKKYINYMDLIEDEDIDAISICTPNYYHSVIAVEALNNGKHVICEKPDAISVSEMQKIIDAEKRSGKIFMAVRNVRMYDANKYFKEIIEQGKCGKIYSGRCFYVRRRGIPEISMFTTKSLSGGGALVDVGIHALDLAIYLMGNPKAVAVSSCTYDYFCKSKSVNSNDRENLGKNIIDVEDSAIGFVRFDNGSCLQLEFCWAGNLEKEEFGVELRGTNRGIRFSSDDSKNVVWGEENGVLTDTKINAKRVSTHDKVYKNFIGTINGTEVPNYTTEQGMNIIKILEGFYKSAECGEEIKI